MTHDADQDSPGLLRRLRQFLLLLVIFGAGGLALELVFLEHWEMAYQRVPLILLVLSAVLAAVVLARPRPASLRIFRGIMILSVLSGFVGMVLHYRANDLLEREMNPDRPAMEIVRAALTGGTPTLAAGAMVQLGLLGLLAVHGHPAGTGSAGAPDPREA